MSLERVDYPEGVDDFQTHRACGVSRALHPSLVEPRHRQRLRRLAEQDAILLDAQGVQGGANAESRRRPTVPSVICKWKAEIRRSFRRLHHGSGTRPGLREVRLEKGITQSALAEKANVGRQWLNAFELGDKWTAPLVMVYRVLSALEASVVMDPEPVAAPTSDDDFIDINLIVDGLAKP